MLDHYACTCATHITCPKHSVRPLPPDIEQHPLFPYLAEQNEFPPEDPHRPYLKEQKADPERFPGLDKPSPTRIHNDAFTKGFNEGYRRGVEDAMKILEVKNAS